MSLSINGSYDSTLGQWFFNLTGEIDISNAQELKNRLTSAFGENKADIMIDVSNLSYIDSTGLGVIIGVYNGIKSEGHRIVLLGPKDNVRKLLKITNLDKVLC